MGTVYLAQSPEGLYIVAKNPDLAARVLLTREQLARPIHHISTTRAIGEDYQAIIRAAIEALFELKGLDAALSLDISEHNDDGTVIKVGSYVWAEITLGSPDNVIVALSHNSISGKPYYSVLDWLEDLWDLGSLDTEGQERLYEEWSSTEQWTEFFKARLLERATKMHSDAEMLRKRADEEISTALAIRALVGSSR